MRVSLVVLAAVTALLWAGCAGLSQIPSHLAPEGPERVPERTWNMSRAWMVSTGYDEPFRGISFFGANELDEWSFGATVVRSDRYTVRSEPVSDIALPLLEGFPINTGVSMSLRVGRIDWYGDLAMHRRTFRRVENPHWRESLRFRWGHRIGLGVGNYITFQSSTTTVYLQQRDSETGEKTGEVTDRAVYIPLERMYTDSDIFVTNLLDANFGLLKAELDMHLSLHAVRGFFRLGVEW